MMKMASDWQNLVAIEHFFKNYPITLKIDFWGFFGIANNKMASDFKMAVKQELKFTGGGRVLQPGEKMLRSSSYSIYELKIDSRWWKWHQIDKIWVQSNCFLKNYPITLKIDFWGFFGIANNKIASDWQNLVAIELFFAKLFDLIENWFWRVFWDSKQ